MSYLRPFGVLALLLAPTQAWAIEAVVAPFVPTDGDEKTAFNVTSIVSSEMEFMPEYDFVEQSDERPSGLRSSCVTSASCLRGVTGGFEAEHVMVGTTTSRGAEVAIKAVLFDRTSGKIVNQQDFTVPADTMADDIGQYVRAVITGDTPAIDEPPPVASDDFSFDDDDSASASSLSLSSVEKLGLELGFTLRAPISAGEARAFALDTSFPSVVALPPLDKA